MLSNISVIIPIYNRQDLIIDTLKSIERQNILPDEVIVIDDKSTDNSINVVNKYSENSNVNIKVIDNYKSKGQSGALNCGIEIANGMFIAMHDSDDLWTPNHLQQLHEVLLEMPNVDIAYSEIAFFGDAKDLISKQDDFKYIVDNCLKMAFDNIGNNIWLSNRKLLHALLKHGVPFRCPASLIRRKFIFEHKLFFNEGVKYTLDSQFMTMAAYYTPFIYISKKGLSIRRHGENDGDVKYRQEFAISYQNRIDELKRYFSDKSLNREERLALNSCIYEFKLVMIKIKWHKMKIVIKMKESLKLFIKYPYYKTIKIILKLVLKENRGYNECRY